MGHAGRALVPPLSRGAHRCRRSAALDGALPELEHDVRGVSLHRPAQGLRRQERQLCHELGRDRRGLRGVPRAGGGARQLGQDSSRRCEARERSDRPAGEFRRWRRALRGRGLRAVPLAPRPAQQRGAAAPTLPRSLRAGDAARGPLPRQRPDPGGGVRLRLVPSEPDVPGGGALQRLPRPAFPRVLGAGQRALRALPRGASGPAFPQPRRQALRHARAPLPSGRLAERQLRRLPHARAHLHGRGPAARSQLAHSAPRSHGQARHAQHLQRLPRGPLGRLGRRGGGHLVRPRAAAGAPLRRGVRRRTPRRCGGRAGARRARSRRRPAGDRPRHGARAAARPGTGGRASPDRRDERPRSAGPGRRRGRARHAAAGAAHRSRRTAARGSAARGARGGGARARVATRGALLPAAAARSSRRRSPSTKRPSGSRRTCPRPI